MESIECLKGNGPSDLEELVVTQGGLLLLTSQGAVQILHMLICSACKILLGKCCRNAAVF